MGATAKQIGIVTVLLSLALVGSICLCNPARVIAFLQRRYELSKMFRATLYSNAIFKPWYPVVVRFYGLVIWAFVIFSFVGLWNA